MTQKIAKVAVIVPVYNGEKYLAACISSLRNQTFPDLELWLVDDGSQDGSAKICDEAAEQDERIHVLHKENEGLMATWIRGVKESKAPFLCFVDCDDWLETDCLQKMTAALDEDDKGQVICGGYVIEREWNHTQEKKESAAAPGIYEGKRLLNEIQSHLLGNEKRTLILSRCMKLISRDLLERNLFYCDPRIRMGEDVNIMTPVLLDARRVVVLEDNYDYHYRFVAESMVHGYDAGMPENMQRLREVLHRVMEDRKLPNGHNQVEEEYLLLLFLVLKNELRREDAPRREVIRRVQELCRREDSTKRAGAFPGSIEDPANRLLLMVMKHPSAACIGLVRDIFRLQAGKSRRSKEA